MPDQPFESPDQIHAREDADIEGAAKEVAHLTRSGPFVPIVFQSLADRTLKATEYAAELTGKGLLNCTFSDLAGSITVEVRSGGNERFVRSSRAELDSNYREYN